MGSLFSVFRKVAFIEGLSYVLILINMIIVKRLMPELGQTLVFPIGITHGVLFVAYIILSFLVMSRYNLSFKWLVVAFVASIIPFMTFYMEKKWKQQEADLAKA